MDKDARKILKPLLDREQLTFVMTRGDALEMGLLTCECGHPQNNHFDHDSWPCAHCKCKQFTEVAVRGKLLEKPHHINRGR